MSPVSGAGERVPTIYFVRHGETDWNVAGRLQGTKEIGLNARGRVQAEEAGRRLADLVADTAALDYVASPLVRTRDTMERLRAALQLPRDAYATDDRVVELGFGRWEGLTWREVRRTEPALAAARRSDKWGFVPPGGESYAMLLERVAPAIASLSRPTVLVSHGGVARTLLASLGGMPPATAATADIWQGRILVFEDGHHRWA